MQRETAVETVAQSRVDKIVREEFEGSGGG
jgi:hypothetical protein